jgi:hypothetical protein
VALTVPKDTSVDAHDQQSELYRRMGGRGRVDVVYRLNQAMRRMTVAGIQARHPDYSAAQVESALARVVLGDALVRAVWPDRELVDP